MKILKLAKAMFILLLPLSVYSQTDNTELQKMYNEDQGSRSAKNIDWSLLTKQDKEREKRVYELIKSNQVLTARDYYNSAMIFQHGDDTVASSMAVKQMRKAIELDATIDKWLLAAAIDRDLMRRQKPQIYGTQYVKNTGEAKWRRYKIDTTQITDDERKYYKVETLSAQVEKERNMNLVPISTLHEQYNEIKKTIELIKIENKKGQKSTYNTSEGEINSFAYELLKSGKKNDALEVFLLNTELYPEEFNTFDSLGECLLLLGKKEEGIKAYEKSLKLNPKNENARQVINGVN